MPRLSMVTDDRTAKTLRNYAKRAGVSVSQYLNELVHNEFVWAKRDKIFLAQLEKNDTFDKTYGTETSKVVYPIAFGLKKNISNANLYGPTLPCTFQKIMEAIDIRHEDFIFVDFGSGKGRVLLMASDYPFKKIIGIEFSPRLHHVALKNIDIYKSSTQRCNEFELLCQDVMTYQIPSENTVFYLYDSFKRPLLSQVMKRIRASLKKNPRKIFIIYLEYKDEFNDLFAFLKVIKQASPETAPQFRWIIFSNQG